MSYANIFESKKEYNSTWEIVNVRRFTEEELLMVKSAEIVEGQYGLCAKCFMVGGKTKFLDLGKYSNGQIGEKVDLKDARIITLERDGATCEKVEF
jgi:hypothetical protein